VIKRDSRSRVLIRQVRLDECINAELDKRLTAQSASRATIASINTEETSELLRSSFELISKLRKDNRDSFEEKYTSLTEGYTIKDRFLLYLRQLYIRKSTTLYTDFIREAHDQLSSIHLSSRKTY
jgi:hypothetical protein